MKERALELKVGLLVLLAAVVLAGFLFVLGNCSLGKGYRLYVDYDFSGNLQEGAPVKVSGIRVGRVEEIRFLGGQIDQKTGRRVQVRVEIWVEDRVRETVRQDAEFFVNTSNVLGEQYLEIAPGSYDRPALAPGAIVVGVNPPRTDLIVARLYEFLDSVTTLLHDDKDLIRDLLKSSTATVTEVNRLLADNREQIRAILASAARFTDESTGLIADLWRGLGDPRLLGRTLADVDAAVVSARRSLDELTPRAVRLADEATRVAGLLDATRVDRALAAADRAAAFLEGAATLVARLDALVADVAAGKGTAGALLVRDEVYADLKEMVRDLRRNPWKLFWKD